MLLFGRRGTSRRGKAYLGGFLVLSLASILLSTSRTAWFSIVLTASIMAIVVIRSKKTILLMFLVSALALVSAYQLVPIVHDRIDRISDDVAMFFVSSKKASSIGSRFHMWKASLMMFQSRPFLGVGTGDYIHAMEEFRRLRLLPRYLLDYNQPHNMYLFTMATNGIVGLTALLLIFYRSLRFAVPTVRSGDGEKLCAFLAMATAVHFMIAGFMDSFFNIQILRYSFAFVMGVCIRGSANSLRRP
jgi:O-antigen ligase